MALRKVGEPVREIPAHLLRFDDTGLDPGPDTVAAYWAWDDERTKWVEANGYWLTTPDGCVVDWPGFFADVKRQEVSS